MADSTKTNSPQEREDEIRQVFETMQLRTQEQRARAREQGRGSKQPRQVPAYSLRLSYSSGPATTKD